MMIPTMTGHLWYVSKGKKSEAHSVYALAVGFGHAIVP